MRPKKYEFTTTLRLTEDVKAKIDELSIKEGILPVDWIRKAISEKITRDYKTTSESTCISISEILDVLDNPLIKTKIRDIVAEG